MTDYGKPQRETIVAPFRRQSGLVTELGSQPGPHKLPPTRPLPTQIPSTTASSKSVINKAKTPMRLELEARLAEQRAKPVVQRPPRPIVTGGAMANDPVEGVGRDQMQSLPQGATKIK